MKKVLIVAPANLEVCPYVKKYLDLFATVNDISVDLISWNRYKTANRFNLDNYRFVRESFIYSKKSSVSLNPFRKISHFVGFSKFIIRTYEKFEYDKVFLLTSSSILFMPSSFLKKIDYIFDYRDTSYEWFLPFKLMVTKTIKYSKCCLISSDGFRMVLPRKYNYVNIHNIDAGSFVYPNEQIMKSNKKIPIIVSYVGLFVERDHMLKAINFFANDKRFIFNIWGYSENDGDNDALKDYIASKKILNVHLMGRFSREDKIDIYNETDLLLYYYESKFRYRYATANKYYDSLFYAVPCIVNKKTTIGSQMAKDGLGVPVTLTSFQDKQKIIDFYLTSDTKEYMLKRKDAMLNIIMEDDNVNKIIVDFLEK